MPKVICDRQLQGQTSHTKFHQSETCGLRGPPYHAFTVFKGRKISLLTIGHALFLQLCGFSGSDPDRRILTHVIDNQQRRLHNKPI